MTGGLEEPLSNWSSQGRRGDAIVTIATLPSQGKGGVMRGSEGRAE